MMVAGDLPDWAAILTSVLVLLGSVLTLIETIGLLYFKDFYARVHAPTLGTSLGVGCVLLASMLYFSVLQSRPVLHEVLIAVFVTITTPVTLMFLVNAALHRDWSEGESHVPAKQSWISKSAGGDD